MSNIIENIIKSSFSNFYNPINTHFANKSIIDNEFNKIKKMTFDEMIMESKVEDDNLNKIPYETLNEIAEKNIENMIENNSLTDIIEELILIQNEIYLIVSIYYQNINICDHIKSYYDKKYNVNDVLHENKQILDNYKKELINNSFIELIKTEF